MLTLVLVLTLAVACILAFASEQGSPARGISSWLFGVAAGIALAILIGAHS